MKTTQRVLMSGVSSFTGCHIAKACVSAGYEVHGILTQPLSKYEILKKERLIYSGISQWVEHCSFGSDQMMEEIQRIRPHYFINHGAEIQGYRSPQFDYVQSLKSNLFRSHEVIQTLKLLGCLRFIHSGSFFEPGEGSGLSEEISSSPALSIYGVSKKMTWDVLRFYCEQQHLALSKIVIPNPVGSFENEDRLIPAFVKMWKNQELPKLQAGSLVRDQLLAPWLAQTYVRTLKDEKFLQIHRPSGWVSSNRDFMELFISQAQKLLPNSKLKFQVEYLSAVNAEAPIRKNSEPVPELKEDSTPYWREWFEQLKLN